METSRSLWHWHKTYKIWKYNWREIGYLAPGAKKNSDNFIKLVMNVLETLSKVIMFEDTYSLNS